MLKDTLKGAVIASAVASMFALSAHAQDKAPKKAEKAEKTMCSGINSCKGEGSCAGADNSCAGKNECKGKGVMAVKNAKECTDKGGKVVAKK